MNARSAKQRALLRMQRHPRPNSKFVPARRYGVRGGRALVIEIGQWEDFRFFQSVAIDVLRE